MADTPDNPPPPPPSPPPAPTPGPARNPWIYPDVPGGGYYTPPKLAPEAPGSGSVPLPGEPGSVPVGEPGTVPVPRAPDAYFAAPVAAAGSEASASTAPAPAASVAASAAQGVRQAETGDLKAGKKSGKEAQDDASLAGVIDTIEAIIIALIVALTFRAFVVEAFVIPTGSMAPTLLGAHYKVICPKCGYEFDMDANLRRQVHYDKNSKRYIPGTDDNQAELADNRGVPLEQLPICPNCRYVISARELPQFLEAPVMPDGSHGGASQSVPLAWANNGDRILVLKYLYSIMPPKRWDVIVFKEPEHADSNYIKRLIGLPGETVQIINGDIYIMPPDDTNPAHWQIARKPEEIQQALWQLVYNNDFYATDEGKVRTSPLRDWDKPVWTNPWQPDAAHAGGWTKGPVMSYGGGGVSSLQFQLVPPGAPAGYPPYGLNTLGYNTDLYVDEFNGEFAPRSIVGDLRMEALWTPQRVGGPVPEASITLTLGRPNNCYRLTWGHQGMELEHLVLKKEATDPADHWVKVDAQTVALPGVGAGGAAMPAPEAGRSYQLALNNVDHALQFYVDGKKVLWFDQPWTAAQAMDDIAKYPADWTNSLSQGPQVWGEADKARANTRIQIDVSGPCDISHLKVFRDLFYTQVRDNTYPATGTQANPLTLGADEFFALGDNSRRSADGRVWRLVHPPLGDLGVRAGIVPRRYLLGKAFFVYWPAGYTPLNPRSSIPVLNNIPLVPDTGDTRIIR